MPNDLSLHLLFRQKNEEPELIQCEFSLGKETIRSGRTEKRKFLWTKGVRVLTLALVRLARWQGIPSEQRPERIPVLENSWIKGKRLPEKPDEESLQQNAVSLEQLVFKSKTVIQWPADMFSFRWNPVASDKLALLEAHSRLNQWFTFEESYDPIEKVLRANVNVEELPPEAIKIFVIVNSDGVKEMTGKDLDIFERRLARTLDGSIPPLPRLVGESGVKLTGYLPPSGPKFVGRQKELADISNIERLSETRILVLWGLSGAGKSALAAEWLATRCKAWGKEGLSYRLIFSWVFNRQGNPNESEHYLEDFFPRLFQELRLPWVAGMNAHVKAKTLLDALLENAVLLLLDGIEALVDDGKRAGSDKRRIKDPTLAELLRLFAECEKPMQSRILITSQIPLNLGESLSTVRIYHRKVGSLKIGVSALAWGIATGQSMGEPHAEDLILEIKRGEDDSAIPTLVQRVMELLGDSPGRALVYAVTFFNRVVDLRMLKAFLEECEIAERLGKGCASLTATQWEEALNTLRQLQIATVDKDGRVNVPEKILKCIRADFQRTMPETWIKGQRWLRDYFAKSVPHQPDRVEDMHPLLWALWHGCQAGDYRQAHEEIGRPRIARDNGVYLMNELGEFELFLSGLSYFTPNHRDFPCGCDFDDDTKALIVNACTWCLEYLGRLDRAYECTKKGSLERLTDSSPTSTAAPIITHVLYLQFLHGDFRDSMQLLRRLFREVFHSSATPESFLVDPSFIAVAFAMMGTTIANLFWKLGKFAWSRRALDLMTARCSMLLRRPMRLAPSFVGPWHALLLLDMDRWQEVDEILAAGELEAENKRSLACGINQLIYGRLFSAKAKSLSLKEKEKKIELEEKAEHVLRAGLASLENSRSTKNDGLVVPEDGGFHWHRCAFRAALANHLAGCGRRAEAMEAAVECIEMASRNRLRSLEIDGAITIASLKGEKLDTSILRKIKESGYYAALPQSKIAPGSK